MPSRPARDWLLFASGRVIPLLLCLLYVGLWWTSRGAAPGGSFSSLGGVIALFAVPSKVVVGWVHFLAFDLLLGRAVVDDCLRRASPRWVLVFALPPLFLYGPLGLLVYAAIAAVVEAFAPIRGSLPRRWPFGS